MRADGLMSNNAGSAWDEAKSAIRADWEEKREPAATPTLSGMSLPWSRAERALRFGYSAAQWYGRRHPAWSAEIEERLAVEWNLYRPDVYRWRDIREVVRHAYEFGLPR